jgi:tetraacyldisaccharide 4'-kinase
LEPLRGRTDSPASLSGRRVGLLSSIGDPEGFTATAEGLQAHVVWHRAFPDHHPYDGTDWTSIRDQLRAQRPDGVLTTEKDWVRLEPLARQAPLDVPVWVLRVQMELLDGQAAFTARLAGARTP